MRLPSKHTRQFFGRIWIPGLMFLTVCLMHWAEKTFAVAGQIPPALVSFDQAKAAVLLITRSYILIIGALFGVCLVYAIDDWVDARRGEKYGRITD